MSDLDRAGARYAIVGGLAVGIRTEPRFTRDADMAISVAGDAQAESIIFELVGRGYRTVATLEQELTGRLATVRLTPPLGEEASVIVDLLFASCGIEPEVVAAATVETIAVGVSGPVASIGHLIAMKTLSERDSRFQDREDLLSLIRESGPTDLQLAVAATALITERGYARDKDLAAVLQSFIALARVNPSA